jgi:hypothetical protein
MARFVIACEEDATNAFFLRSTNATFTIVHLSEVTIYALET